MFAPATRLAAACLVALLVVTLGACERVDPVERVRRLHATGFYAESLEPLRELIDGGTRDPEVLYLYGMALTATGEPTLALWALEQAMQDPEWLVAAGMARAWGALSTRSHDSAVRVVSRVLEVEPDNLPARALRARARVESRRDYEGGLADAELVLEEDPDNLEALISKAVALLAQERADEAEVVLEQLEERFRAAELGPEVTARYCFTRVEFAKERGQLETAEERLERCLDELPAALIGVSESVDFYDELGRPERSVEVLRAALEETPSAIHYRSGLAARLRLLGREDEAEALLREAVEVEDRGQAMLGWVALGEYYLAGERADEAADALARALEIGDDAELAFLYANALLAAGRHDEALAVADSTTVPVFAFLIRGRVEQLQGRPNEALAQLEQGLELWPNNAVARYYAGRAAEDAGDLARAVGEYRYALRADPAAADTRTRLAQLYIAAGRPEAAFNTVTHGWSRRPGTPEQELVALELAAQLGNRPQYVKARLQRMRRPPELRARAVAAAARGLARARGEVAALRFLAEQQLDLGRPVNLPALEVVTALLIEAGRPVEALAGIEGALAVTPGFAPFHALRGDALLAAGRKPEARAAYARARELDPEAARGVAGLARLARGEGEVDTAIALFDQAAAADPSDVSSRLAAAELRIAEGRFAEARDPLEQALELEPYDPAVLAALARVERAADPSSVRGQALELRAARVAGDARRPPAEADHAAGPAGGGEELSP